jgi:Tol biopolymer transport system component
MSPRDESPSFSPDNKYIVYRHLSNEYIDTLYPTGIYIIDIETQKKSLLIRNNIALDPDWSPKENLIVFSSGDIYTMDSFGQNLKKITHFGECYFPKFSKDGEKILFDAWTYEKDSINSVLSLWSIDKNGTNLKRINPFGVYGMRDADWSPDGRKIVYTGNQDGYGESQIWIADTNGANRMRLTSSLPNCNSPAWSNNNKIAFVKGNTSERGIWVIQPNGKNQFKLIDGFNPSWSSDGNTIAFFMLVDNNSGTKIFTINIDQSNLKQITY